MLKLFFLINLAVLVACVYSASLNRNKRQAASKFLLPDGAEFILTSQIDDSYVCSDEGKLNLIDNINLILILLYLINPFISINPFVSY